MEKKTSAAQDEESAFWAEQIAEKVKSRKKFALLDKENPKLKTPTVKSSSSLSGVLHIGRLSDIIRGEAVYKALTEFGLNAGFIYVAEDMDPLRKIPKGVPKTFEKYIGFSVSDVPDPKGCHESYAKHFLSEFLETLGKFLYYTPKVYSMREEYKKGNFNESILALVRHTAEIKEIIERLQGSKLSDDWSPWKPICDNCGNLQTTVVTSADREKINYVCRDYEFEQHTAKGCGHEGTSGLKKANGKLVWKSEWAAQWKRWSVVAEGAGKEYNAPNSAFFVNAEISERILGFPMPEPVFYEHIYIGGQKMSASIGNVIYPHNWLEVSRPETLKYLYMKKINKARSFSWVDIPNLESEFDRVVEAHAGRGAQQDGKTLTSQKKLFEYSMIKGRKAVPLTFDYSLASALVQLFPGNAEVLAHLKEMGHLGPKPPKEELAQAEERVSMARRWCELYAPPEMKISFAEKIPDEAKKQLTQQKKAAIKEIVLALPHAKTADEIQQVIFNSARQQAVQPGDLFRLLYLALAGRERGPKLGSLVPALGKEKVINRLKELC